MIERFLQGLAGKFEEPAATELLIVLLPEDLDPEDRHFRFGASLDAELRLAGLGYSDGGGTMFTMDGDAFGDVLFTVVDVNAVEVDGARALLRLHLPELGCPEGTLVQFRDREDRWDGERWHLDEERSIDEA